MHHPPSTLVLFFVTTFSHRLRIQRNMRCYSLLFEIAVKWKIHWCFLSLTLPSFLLISPMNANQWKQSIQDWRKHEIEYTPYTDQPSPLIQSARYKIAAIPFTFHFRIYDGMGKELQTKSKGKVMFMKFEYFCLIRTRGNGLGEVPTRLEISLS